MAAIIATAQNYWISTSALTITLNALGEANRVQASVASGAQIMCYIRGVDGLDFDEGHNYRRWPLTVSPTFFNTNTHKYLYVVIPRTTAIGTQAMVWFPSVKLDVYGRAIDDEGEPAEQVGNPDYYYIWLQGIISSSGASGNTPRTWEQQPQTGTLATDEAISPAGGEWYRWDAISQTVTFLKDIWMDAASQFRNLILGGKTLTGVATDDSTPGDSTTHVVTPAYLKTQYSNKYIRKDQDDSTPYNLGVEQSLNVGKDLAVDGDATIVGTTRANVVQSDNYTGDGVADTGYRLTKDDGTGSSKLTVDNLYVRKKATFEELEVRKETAIAGNQIYSSAANIILRTDYFDANGQLMGYSTIVVPYLLKRVPFLLRMLSRASRTGFFGRQRRLRMFLEAEDIPKIRRVRCYFLAKDDDRTIDNLWQCNEQGADLARCQTMNLHNSNRSTYIHGMETKLGNVYWWRKLCGVSSKPVTIDGDDREYHYFDVMFDYNAEQQYRQQGQQCPWADVASGDIPCAGDHVVQFGNDLNPDRMNLIAVEVNSSSDAPAHKWYRGIYTFDLSKCWWGGNPRKDMISAASGVEFYGPSFKVQTEYGIAKVPKDRDEVNWSDIATQRDDYGEHPDVRKCYSYDAITHGGCRWLCLLPDGAHWVCPQQWDDDTYALFDANGNYRHNGNYITNTQYNALTTEQKQQCGRIPNYTTLEPGTKAAEGVWKKIVDKGANSIRIDLDNENDTMLYSSTKGLVSGNVYSHGSLMDGTTDVTAKATWAIVPAGCTATISGSTVTVTAMSAATGSVMVRATYNGQTYEKELTLKRIVDGDKFELIISPNSIAYNTTTDTPAASTLAIQVFKTACDGTRALSAPPSGYQVYANGTALTATATGTYSYTTDNSAISEVLVKIATSSSSTDSLDAETIPINKAANGKSITKKSETYRYATNNTGTRPAASSSDWKTTKPTLQNGYWLYTETTITWSDNSTTVLYTDERNPNDGVAGQDIIVDGATVMKYYVGDSNTTHPADTSSDWKDLSQVTQTQGKWLWSQATTYYRKASSAAGSHDAGTSYNYNVSYISKDGKTGRGISSITEYYQATNSSAARTAPTSTTGWSTDPNLSDLTDKWDQNHKYLWNMERTIYANVDGTTTTTYSIPQIVAIWTKDGSAGRGIDSIVNYYKITSTATAPSKPSTPGTDGWTTTPGALSAGQYLWNYERITWINPAGTTETDVQMIGYAGTDGASITKASADTFRYAIGDSGITPPSSGWSTTKPSTFDKNKWLWTETTIHWSDGSTTTLYSAERNPNDGVNGQDIIVDGATIMKYYVGDSNTTHPADTSSDWKDLSQVTQTQGKWLWSQATTYYRKASSAAGSHDAGVTYNYNVSYISKDGKTGRGISSITEYYQATNSSAARTAPTSTTGWSTDPNLADLTDKWDQNHKYLWNMERTIYANVDGTTTTEYSIPQIVAIWTKDGDPGAAGKGIDSIVNYYKITSTNTAPSKPSTPGTGGWTTTPGALSAGQYLWNYERITWVNPAGVTETDVQMIGYAGTNGQDSTVPGPPGDDGDDGWTIIANPANVILTQSMSSSSSFSTADVSFSAKKGSRTATVSNLTGISEYHFDVTKTGNSSIRVNYPKSSGSSYYTEGYFEVTVHCTDPDTSRDVEFTVRVLCYANLLGSWKSNIVDDTKTEIANQDFYYYDANGDVVRKTTVGEYIRSSQSASSNLKATINGKTTESYVNQKANEINIGIRDDLGNTGIDITSGEIKLKANKVNFYDSTGTNLNSKIWLDSTYGTLHAVDGEFEGKVTAEEGTIGGFAIGSETLGTEYSSGTIGGTYIRNDGYMRIYNQKNYTGLSVLGGVDLNGDSDHGVYLSNTGGSVNANGNTLNLNTNANNNNQVNIGSYQTASVNINGSAANFGSSTPVSVGSSLAVQGPFVLGGDTTFITNNRSTAKTVALPSNASRGQVIFAKGTVGDLTLTGAIRNDEGSIVTSIGGDRRSRIFIYGDSYWNEFYCS